MQVEINHRTLGRLVQGSCLDVQRKPFERKLKQFDPYLYLRWNPYKKQGLGSWELRRRPEQATAVFWSNIGHTKFFSLEYVESNLIHHVMDLERLDYNVLDRLYAMDTWRVQGNYGADLEYREDKAQAAIRAQNKDELRYQIRHHRKEFNYLLEEAKSGRNPLKFLMGK